MTLDIKQQSSSPASRPLAISDSYSIDHAVAVIRKAVSAGAEAFSKGRQYLPDAQVWKIRDALWHRLGDDYPKLRNQLLDGIDPAVIGMMSVDESFVPNQIANDVFRLNSMERIASGVVPFEVLATNLERLAAGAIGEAGAGKEYVYDAARLSEAVAILELGLRDSSHLDSFWLTNAVLAIRDGLSANYVQARNQLFDGVDPTLVKAIGRSVGTPWHRISFDLSALNRARTQPGNSAPLAVFAANLKALCVASAKYEPQKHRFDIILGDAQPITGRLPTGAETSASRSALFEAMRTLGY